MSELYELPDGWEWQELSEISKKIFAGGDKPEIVSETKTDELNIPIYANGAKNNGLYGYSNVYKIDEECLTISARGTIGFTVVRNEKFLPIVRLIVVIPNDKVLSKILKYYLDYELVENTGSSIPQLTVPTVKKLKFPLPPLPEQQRIVSKLDLLFEKIDKSIALHQKNMDEANAFMGSVLNDVFGELEEKYEKKYLDEISFLIDGDRGSNYPKKEEFFENEFCLFLNAKNVTKNGFLFYEKQFITKEKDNLLRKGKLDREDLIITTRGTIGNVAIYDKSIEFDNVRINSGMAIIRLKNMSLIYNRYIYKYLFSPQFLDYLSNVQSGSAQPQITIKNLKESIIPIPPLQIQQKTVIYLDEISQKLEKIKQLQKEKMASLKALKASILDSAFRGEL